jgi:hypothetical protein
MTNDHSIALMEPAGPPAVVVVVLGRLLRSVDEDVVVLPVPSSTPERLAQPAGYPLAQKLNFWTKDLWRDCFSPAEQRGDTAARREWNARAFKMMANMSTIRKLR